MAAIPVDAREAAATNGDLSNREPDVARNPPGYTTFGGAEGRLMALRDNPTSPVRPVDRVLDRLPDARRNGEGFTARCPAHPDRTPSLSIAEGDDGRALVHCHAGCEHADVLAALDLGLEDLFADKKPTDKPVIVTTYPYVDADGKVLFEVVRTSPKGFRQRRPDGRDGWVWNLKGVESRPLYRLPKVLAAVAAGRLVWIVEGEKDADRLQRELPDGEVATTCPGGAGKWRPEHTAALTGAGVMVVADRDNPGRAHARTVARALAGVAVSVSVVEPTVGKDASDHLDAGHGPDDFTALSATDEFLDVPDRRTFAETKAEARRLANGPDPAPGLPELNEAWAAPAPLIGSRSLPAFPVDALPGWVGAQVSAVTEFTQTPPDLAGSIALAALATAAGGRVVVEVRGTWREPTNLFIVVAMPPGSRKSAVFAEMTGPLLVAERDLIDAEAPKIIEAATRLEIAQKEAQEARAAAARADGEARDGLRSSAVEAAQTAEAMTVPAQPRLVADDVTPEAAATLLAEQGGRLAVLSAEGGIFAILAGRYTSGAPSIEVFLKGHAGDLLRIDRKGRPPEHVASPALTLGLTVQPDVLRSIATMPGFRGRGLLARILYIVPVNNVGHRKIGTDPVPADLAENYTTNLRNMVTRLAKLTEPEVLTLTPAAADLLLQAEREIEPKLAPGAELGHLADWASKLIGATARVAALIHLGNHLSDGTTRPIEPDTMAAAIRVADYFTAHAVAAFEAMGADEITDQVRAVLQWAQRHHLTECTRRDVHQAHRSLFRTAADVDPALGRLEDLGWLHRRPDPEPGAKGGRPPSPTYEINPHNSQNPHNPTPPPGSESSECSERAE